MDVVIPRRWCPGSPTFPLFLSRSLYPRCLLQSHQTDTCKYNTNLLHHIRNNSRKYGNVKFRIIQVQVTQIETYTLNMGDECFMSQRTYLMPGICHLGPGGNDQTYRSLLACTLFHRPGTPLSTTIYVTLGI